MTATHVPARHVRSTVHRITMQLRPTRRLVRLSPLAITSAAAGILIWRMQLGGDHAEIVLAGAVGIGVSTVFGDDAAVTLASSPTSRWVRSAARCTIVLPLAVVLWVVVRSLATRSVGEMSRASWLEATVPGRDAWLVFAVAIGAVLAIEAACSNRNLIAGVTGSAALVVGSIAVLQLPEPLTLLPIDGRHARWLACLALSGAGLCLALRDPV